MMIGNPRRRLWVGGALLAFTLFGAAPAGALDRLGARWEGCEYDNPATRGFDCEWQFEWRRVTANSNVFNAYWSHRKHGRFQGRITITLSGTSVTVQRPALGGGPPCTYWGTYRKRDVHNGIPARVSGTMSCGSYTGPWRATIR